MSLTRKLWGLLKNMLIRNAILIVLISNLFACQPQKVFLQPTFAFKHIVSHSTHDHFSLDSIPFDIKFLIINFFAPDCSPCIKELPTLVKFYHHLLLEKSKAFFLGVGSTLDNVNGGSASNIDEIRQHVSKFTKQHQLKYPVYIADFSILKTFKLTGFPETFIFKRVQGNNFQLYRKFVGQVTKEDLKKYVF